MFKSSKKLYNNFVYLKLIRNLILKKDTNFQNRIGGSGTEKNGTGSATLLTEKLDHTLEAFYFYCLNITFPSDIIRTFLCRGHVYLHDVFCIISFNNSYHLILWTRCTSIVWLTSYCSYIYSGRRIYHYYDDDILTYRYVFIVSHLSLFILLIYFHKSVALGQGVYTFKRGRGQWWRFMCLNLNL